jgi:hypothetical protein
MSHQCEEENCTSTEAEAYIWPVTAPGEKEEVWFCHDHAIENGFCVWCRHFGAGSEDYDFSGHKGYHRECWDELRYEVGESDEDEDDDEYGDWDYYPANWNYPGSAVSELEPDDTPRDIYIGPGSEYEQGESDESQSVDQEN